MRELTFMRDLRCLPLLRDGVTARYEGSIDKAGGNADWDWSLYRDERGEWVLFDHQGAGCVYNFVQHRYPDSLEPTFRFYFDGEENRALSSGIPSSERSTRSSSRWRGGISAR